MRLDTHIAVLGFGVEGRALVAYFLAHGYTDITVCDRSSDVEGIPDVVARRLGDDYLSGLHEFDVVFRSPGISIFRPELQELIRGEGLGMSERRTVVSSMTKYFFEHCPAPIIGVTGTKGKGTTATLIARMLERGFGEGRGERKCVFLGGNIGEPAINFLDDITSDSYVVLELSSFQLADATMSPHIAVVLNVTSEHMDYHSSVAEYRSSKYPIVAYQRNGDVAVMNTDYPYFEEFAAVARGVVRAVSVHGECEGCAAWVDGADVVVRSGGASDECAERVVGVDEIALLGRHNLENVLPAVVVVRMCGVSLDDMRAVLREFRGLPHRLEFVGERSVGERREISFYNDSFSTIPESCAVACRTFEERRTPFVLLAGGSEKQSDFTELARELAGMSYLKYVYLMGPAGARLGGLLRKHGVACEDVADLRTAFGLAVTACADADADAGAGANATKWAIVMSPAAASFNEFKNYKERGAMFKKLVAEIVPV